MTAAPIPANEAERIATLRMFAILDTEKESGFDIIADFVAKQFEVPIALISLVDTDRQWFKSSCGLEEAETPRDLAFCGYTILGDDILYIPDATKDKRVHDNALVTGEMAIRFYCGAPLIAKNGHRLGSLCIIDTKPRHDFAEDKQRQLADLADLVVAQMEKRIASGDALKEAELQHKAAASDRQIRALIDHVPAGVALIDRSGRYLACNSSWLQILSSIDADLSTESVMALETGYPVWFRAFQTALRGDTTINAEDPIQFSGGELEYLRWEVHPWASDDGEIEGVIISAARVTSQVEARKDAERQTEMLNAVLENVKDGIVACDATGRLTLFNRSTRVMHGIDCVPLPPEECTEFYNLYEADGVTPLEPDRIPLFAAMKGDNVVDREMVIAPNDLPKRHIIAQAAPLFGSDGCLLGAVASMADITAAKLAEDRLKASEAHANYVAFHDSLTGLPNRAHLRHVLQDKKSGLKDQKTAAFFLDLNQFKDVNDRLGHKIGDDLLKRTAKLLQKIVGKDAFVGRLGGDEFIIFKPVEDADEALHLGRRIITEVGTPMTIGGHSVVVGASVGLAYYPEHGDNYEELMRRADLAMYKAKASGDNKPVVFDPVFELEAVTRSAMELELGQAIKNGELEVHYQPIVDGQSQQVLGVEALARWTHPERGPISPAEFIPIAEASGLIVELGDWVLRTALAALRCRPDLFLSVNLSPVQFRDVRLVERVFEALEEIGFDPTRLELEITEGLLIYDTGIAQRTIEKFKSKGIRVALDDFGTGYSGLGYIQNFPFDKIKIDRSFVADIDKNPQSAAVVQCVVNLASSLGIIVTAEGIETENHELLLKSFGCHTLQGFKYGRPLPASQFDSILSEPKRRLA